MHEDALPADFSANPCCQAGSPPQRGVPDWEDWCHWAGLLGSCIYMCNARGRQIISDSAGPQLRSIAATILAAFRSTTPIQKSLVSPSRWSSRSTNLSKAARARGKVQLLDLRAQGKGGSVEPSQQLLGKKVLGREGNGVHTHTHAPAELVALGLPRKHDPLGLSSLRQWHHASRVARSCSSWCLTSVITSSAVMVRNILWPWRKWHCARMCCLMPLWRQRQ